MSSFFNNSVIEIVVNTRPASRAEGPSRQPDFAVALYRQEFLCILEAGYGRDREKFGGLGQDGDDARHRAG